MIKNIQNDMLNISKGLSVLYFGAKWCGPCRMMKPILENIDSKLNDKIDILKIDVEENTQLSHIYKIVSIPTMIIFKDGIQTEHKFVGAVSEQKLIDVIENL